MSVKLAFDPLLPEKFHLTLELIPTFTMRLYGDKDQFSFR